jgi:hypothetical protein
VLLEAAPTPMERKLAFSMLARCPEELSQACMTESAVV